MIQNTQKSNVSATCEGTVRGNGDRKQPYVSAHSCLFERYMPVQSATVERGSGTE